MQGSCLLLLISSMWCLVVNVQAGISDPDERDDQVVIFLMDFNIFTNMISLLDLGFFRPATYLNKDPISANIFITSRFKPRTKS